MENESSSEGTSGPEDIMTESTLKAMIRLGEIQENCKQSMDQLADLIETSPVDLFSSEEEKIEVVVFLLDHLREELKTLNPEEPETLRTPPIFLTLHIFLKREDKQLSRKYIKSLYAQEKAKKSPGEYERWKRRFHERYLSSSTLRPRSDLHREGFDTGDAANAVQSSVLGSVVQNGSRLLTQVMKWEVLQVLDEALAAIGPNWGHFVFAAGTTVGYIGIVSLYNLWCWWTGSKSAVRAWKDVIDMSVPFAAGSAAGAGVLALAGLLFGTLGPLGWFAALCVSAGVSVVVGMGVKTLVEPLTTKLLSIPKEKELEESYALIGLTKNASDSEINSAYRKISRRNHPDMVARRSPPPTDEEVDKAVEHFIKVQKAVALIKLRREVEQANQGVDTCRPWKERFQQFVKNLVRLRRQKKDDLDDLYSAIIEDGFPPLEVFVEAVNADMLLRTVRASVRDSWFAFFNSRIRNSNMNPFNFFQSNGFL